MSRQHFSRLCISSTGGGGGKTLLSLGLGRALTRQGVKVRPYKKGPDYIDAAWLSAACRQSCLNLDPFFTDSSGLLARFTAGMMGAGPDALGLVEGNRGLYDGLDAHGSCSTAALARTLAAPILLCINCSKSTRTIAAVLAGLVSFEPDLNFCGVILNNVGSVRHEQAIRTALQACGVLPVLGAIPRLETNPLQERRMGLASFGPGLNSRAEEILDYLADVVEHNCDLHAIHAGAKLAPDLPCAALEKPEVSDKLVKIGYVYDDAFWFYYPENLQALRNEGAELVRISLLADNAENMLEELDALYIGGGFPEDYAGALAQAKGLKKVVDLARQGLPVYAECGGLMALCRGVSNADRFYPMAGLFDAVAVISPKPHGLGYVEGKITAANPFYPQGMPFKGHEFHYSHLKWDTEAPEFALRLSRGKGIADGLDGLAFKNVWASYAHIFAPAMPHWAKSFVRLALQWRQN